MENKVANFVGLNKVVLGIKWMLATRVTGIGGHDRIRGFRLGLGLGFVCFCA